MKIKELIPQKQGDQGLAARRSNGSQFIWRRHGLDRLFSKFSGSVQESLRRIVRCRLALVIATSLTGAVPCLQAADQASDSAATTVGSGKQYRTTIERKSDGELSREDLHQASLLSSQMLLHLNAAAEHMADGRAEAAQLETQKAQRLAKFVRDMLPVTTVTTTVKDSAGKEMYRDVQQVQDDQIPIFQGEIALEVIQPIIDVKKDQAPLKGLQLADADLVYTALLVDLSYIERKLKRAAELAGKEPKESAAELVLAQVNGLRFFSHKEDNPLVKVQQALRLAERQVREKKYEGARANLQLAKVALHAYRALAGESAVKAIGEMDNEIQKLSAEIERPGAADRIRGLWDKAISWFRRESGQAAQTGPEPAKKEEAKP